MNSRINVAALRGVVSSDRLVEMERRLKHGHDYVLSEIAIDHASLVDTNLGAVKWKRCCVKNSKIERTNIGLFRRCHLQNVSLRAAHLVRAIGCVIENVRVSDSEFGSYFLGNQISGVLCERSRQSYMPDRWRGRVGLNALRAVKFVDSDLSAACLFRSSLMSCEFDNCLVSRVELRGTVCEDCSFVACNLTESLKDAKFIRCRFVDCFQHGLSLAEVRQRLQLPESRVETVDVKLEFLGIKDRHRVIIARERVNSDTLAYSKNESTRSIVRDYFYKKPAPIGELLARIVVDYAGWTLTQASVVVNGHVRGEIEELMAAMCAVPLRSPKVR